ncbi:MAG: glycosyltransferase [Deltaproteobacteria bacterium]|nr:MAG: glycosyltransferase [Deltaproteobacteria bacterium]
MNSPLISCIVRVFNGELYLAEALDSILAQTHRPLEVLVVDDGSTDGTAKLVGGYGEKVCYLWQSNAGPAAATNLGLRAARGDFVAFLDADDVWHADKLARQLERFQSRPELDLSVTHVQNFWIPELAEEAAKFRHHRIAKPLPGYSTVTLLARRNLFETVGHFNSALQHGGDSDWFLRAAKHEAVMELLPDVLVYRRLHRTNRSRILAAASRDEYLELVRSEIERARCLGKTNDGGMRRGS